MLSSACVVPINHVFMLVIFNTQGASVNKTVVGSGSESAPKYVGEGVAYRLHFCIFHLYMSTDMPHLVSHHVEVRLQCYHS